MLALYSQQNPVLVDAPGDDHLYHYTKQPISLPDPAYYSDSPSPPPSSMAPDNSQDPFLHSALPDFTPEDSASNKYPPSNTQLPLLEQRRMSEPAALSAYGTLDASATRYQQFDTTFAFNPPARPFHGALQRGTSTPSLRELRHHHFEYPPQQSEWKQDDHSRQRDSFYEHRGDGFDEPISPLQPNFSGGLLNSPTSGMPYSPISENPYGPSPPGTGTSTSSSVAPLSAGSGAPCSPSRSISQHLQRSLSTPNISGEPGVVDRKTYSFVALPGNAVKKRPRRRYDEIERLYRCSWPDCHKSYGTLNHLNAHVTMQKHGSKRSPNEFKELRKQWRKSKKEQEAVAVAMRRGSYCDEYEDHVAYAHERFLSQHSHASHSVHHHDARPHPSHHSLGLPSSVTIGVAERYNVAIDDIRYPPAHERDDGLGVPYEMTARQRYGGGLPASWHAGPSLSRSNILQHEEQDEAFVPIHGHAHHSQLPQLTIGGMSRISSPPPPNSAPASMLHRAHGLPQHSTLLTPLPGYHPSSLIPPLQNSNGNVAYAMEGYELSSYDESDSSGRPGTGHTNISIGGGDDYDRHSQ